MTHHEAQNLALEYTSDLSGSLRWQMATIGSSVSIQRDPLHYFHNFQRIQIEIERGSLGMKIQPANGVEIKFATGLIDWRGERRKSRWSCYLAHP